MVYHNYFIDFLQFWPYDASFLVTFLARACWNSTLTTSTYLMILPCLPPSGILYPIWFLQSHKLFPLAVSLEGIVLLSSRVWKDVIVWALEIGISCITVTQLQAEARNTHTHTHTHTHSPLTPLQNFTILITISCQGHTVAPLYHYTGQVAPRFGKSMP